MLKKYRVHEFSKDLNVASKDIIELLKEKFNGSYNHMTSLRVSELDFLFEYYTKKNEVDNLDEYFSALKSRKPKEQKQIKNVLESYSKEKKENKKENPKLNNIHKTKIVDSKSVESEPTIVVKKQTIKRINTRSDNLNISKYDKKYENFASIKKFDNSFETYSNQKDNKVFKNKHFRKRETESERIKRIENERKAKPIKISIPDNILVNDLAQRLKVRAKDLIKKLVSMGIMASINDVIDFDTASLAAMEFNATVEKEIVKSIEELAIDDTLDKDEDLVPRAPVVVVMGHVDHGKTSILDYIRKSNVASKESGGITQSIGAYKARVNDRDITFLDTPGHEAFTSMRARGAKATDIAILVIAADDGIMPQTIEAINHAKDAEVSIIVAINKIDKPGADVEKVKSQLMNYNLVPEEWGGDIICVPVSAKNGTGISDLLDSVLLVADMKELKANPNRKASGVVIESKVEKGRGVVATLLVMNGTLHIGDLLVAGTSIGKVRSINNELNKKFDSAVPSDAVEVTGLDIAPNGGDTFNVVDNDKLAHELVEQRKINRKTEIFDSYQKVDINNFFDVMKQKDMKEFKIIIKADTNGSAEALKQSIEALSNDEVIVKSIRNSVGTINESDVMLAAASDALIVGFNVKVNSTAQDSAHSQKVKIKLYSIIYDCINEMTDLIKNMLVPETKEVHLGNAECRKIFKIKGVGTIAGCYVPDGTISRGDLVHVHRNNEVVVSDKIVSLKKYKDDVKEVSHGFECGILLENFSDFEVGDIIETYKIENCEK